MKKRKKNIEQTPPRVPTVDPEKPQGRRRLLPFLIGGALAGTLYLLSMPGLLWGGLAFVALAPLLVMLLRAERPLQALVASAAAGLFLFVPGLIWVQYVTRLGWLMLALYCTLWFALAGMIVWRLRTLPMPLFILNVAAVWVLQEFGRSIFLSGFPWFHLAHSLHANITLIQAAELGGAFLITFLLAVVNGLLAAAVFLARRQRKLTRTHAKIAIVTACLLGLWIGYGAVRVAQVDPRPLEMQVGLVQGDIPQSVKEFSNPNFNPDRLVKRVVELTERLAEKKKEIGPDEPPLALIIWPETSVLSSHMLNISPELLGRMSNATYVTRAIYIQQTMRDLTGSLDALMLVGAATITGPNPLYVVSPGDWEFSTKGGKPVYYNSAVLIDRKGELVARYDKIHLVPFGEYIPFERTLPWLRRLVPYETSGQPGRKITIFDMPLPEKPERKVQFAVTICYEDTDEALVRRMARSDIDFLVNISNDAWFHESTELEQHLAASVFRAVENRVGIVRSGNNGISCVLDALGRKRAVLTRTVDGEVRHKGFPGTLIAPVFGRAGRTLYTRIGIVIVPLSFLLLLVSVKLLIRRRRRPTEPEPAPD